MGRIENLQKGGTAKTACQVPFGSDGI